MNDGSQKEALLGLAPATSDWHAEVNYLQVCALPCNGYTLAKNLSFHKAVTTRCTYTAPCIYTFSLILYLQTIFGRLYKPGSSLQGGTLQQLRNLINRRNISSNTDRKFNEVLDFFELVVTAHVLAAAMYFFGMSCITDQPGRNALADTADTTPNNQWCSLQQKVEALVDRYIMVGGMADIQPKQKEVQVQDSNPHAHGIEAEHNYASIPPSDSQRQGMLV